jgi:hypothetical protein
MVQFERDKRCENEPSIVVNVLIRSDAHVSIGQKDNPPAPRVAAEHLLWARRHGDGTGDADTRARKLRDYAALNDDSNRRHPWRIRLFTAHFFYVSDVIRLRVGHAFS